jgi:hypothetical protein
MEAKIAPDMLARTHKSGQIEPRTEFYSNMFGSFPYIKKHEPARQVLARSALYDFLCLNGIFLRRHGSSNPPIPCSSVLLTLQHALSLADTFFRREARHGGNGELSS